MRNFTKSPASKNISLFLIPPSVQMEKISEFQKLSDFKSVPPQTPPLEIIDKYEKLRLKMKNLEELFPLVPENIHIQSLNSEIERFSSLDFFKLDLLPIPTIDLADKENMPSKFRLDCASSSFQPTIQIVVCEIMNSGDYDAIKNILLDPPQKPLLEIEDKHIKLHFGEKLFNKISKEPKVLVLIQPTFEQTEGENFQKLTSLLCMNSPQPPLLELPDEICSNQGIFKAKLFNKCPVKGPLNIIELRPHFQHYQTKIDKDLFRLEAPQPPLQGKLPIRFTSYDLY